VSEPAAVSAGGEPLVRIRLVPVEVFGAGEEDCPGCPATVRFGYGLMDAVSAWSDCNRAIGKIYRLEDIEDRDDEGAEDCITVYVPQPEMAKFEKRHGDAPFGRCPSCHVEYGELPKEHRVILTRPACETPLPHEPAWNLLPFGGRARKPPWKCEWHGWVEDEKCAACRREHREYLDTGTFRA
jgi:hypothetical protein